MSAPLEELRELAEKLANEDHRGPEPASCAIGRRMLSAIHEHEVELHEAEPPDVWHEAYGAGYTDGFNAGLGRHP